LRVEPTVIALWLGHGSTKATQIYLEVHLALKEAALAKVMPFDTVPGQFKPPDELLQFLQKPLGDRNYAAWGMGRLQCWQAKRNAMRRSFPGGIEEDTVRRHHGAGGRLIVRASTRVSPNALVGRERPRW
jgi:hypothetical protein